MIRAATASTSATAFIANNKLVVSFPYNPDHVNIVRALSGARWDRNQRTWTLYNTTQNKTELKALWPTLKIIDKEATDLNDTAALYAAANKKFLPKTRDIIIKDFVFATEPMAHQKVTFNFCRSLDCSAILLEQGLGKTKVLIDLATWRFRMGQINICFVLAPMTVVGEFANEIEKHGHKDFNDLLVLDDKSTKKRQQRLEELIAKLAKGGKFNGFIITNIDSLGNLERGLRNFLIEVNAKQKLFQMMALDESSKIKHGKSQRSKAVWKVGRTVKYRNILTGTLISQGAEDVFGQYRFLDERIFGTMVTAFRGTYLIMGGFEKRQVVGYVNMEEFLDKVYSVGIRFTKEICLKLPRKNYRRRVVRLDDKVSKLYREVEREAVSEWDGQQIIAPLAITRMQKAAQIASGFLYQHDESGKLIGAKRIHTAKIDALKEELDEVDGKIIIWAHLNEEQKMIIELLKKMKVGFVELSVNDDMDSRRRKIKAFRTDPKILYFVSKPTIAGYGVTLIESHHVIYIGNSHNAEHRWQSEDRNHRHGQKNAVTYTDIVAETSKGYKTYDHDALKSLSKKSAFAKDISSALIARMAARHMDIIEGLPKDKRKAAKSMIDSFLEDEDRF